jgi:hypothetical protein
MSPTPAAPTLNGPIYQNSGTAVFTGTGTPGSSVYILENGTQIGSAGVVAADGSFMVVVPLSSPIVSGDIITASMGSVSNPPSSGIVASNAPSGNAAIASTQIDSGATVLIVSGVPFTTVSAVDIASNKILGTGVVGSNGKVAITLQAPVVSGQSVDLVSGAVIQNPVTILAVAGQAATVSSGGVIANGSLIQGKGIPGASIDVVDSSGRVLGTTVVNSQGNFSLVVNGLTPGLPVAIVQNGLKSTMPLRSIKVGSDNVVTTANVFKPLQGGTLGINILPLVDDHVTVRIFDIAGELVRPLVELDVKAGILYAESWDGKNDDGSTVASGIYFITVRGQSIHTLKKVIVLK